MNLKEFSTKLGLSPTTVSRALGGYPEVNESTRQRIAEAAIQYGYQPNQRARALALGRGYAIGHVLSRSNRNELVNPIFGDFIAGASEAAAEAGFDISLSVAEDDNQEAIYRKLKAGGVVAGVVLQSPQVNDPRIDMLRSIGLDFVVHGRASQVTSPYSWIDVNNLRAFRRAAKFLTDLGHRRIALINGDLRFDFAQRRQSGYLEALAQAEIPLDTTIVKSGEMNEANGYSAAKDLLSSTNPPTAFLASSVISAMGIRRAADELGLELGRDISLVTFDDELSYLSNPREDPFFTSVRSSVRLAGQEVAKMLIDKIQNPDRQPQHLLLEAELVVGASTGPVAS